MALKFPKSAHLRRSPEFLQVKTRGRTHGGRYMSLGVLKNAGPTKVGLITSRRVGGAVVRNRIRRRLRELVRTTLPAWIPGVWVVVIARQAAATASFTQLREEWLRLAKRAAIFTEPSFLSDPVPKGGVEKSGASGDTGSVVNL